MRLLTEKAEIFAEIIHSNQEYDGQSYMIHINEVRDIVKEFAYLVPCDMQLMDLAALLHDTIEDGGKAAKEMYKMVKRHFGQDAADIVWDVTNEIGRNRKEQNIKTYPKIASNDKATFLKLCDRIANVRNALKNQNRMFFVYKEEYAAFRAAIYKSGQFDSMWAVLDNIFENEEIMK